MARDSLTEILRVVARAGAACAMALAFESCASTPAEPSHLAYQQPEDAVRALNDAVAGGRLEEVVAIFGPDGKELIDSSDPVTARRNRQVYTVAVREAWRLVDTAPDRKELVIGHEGWPFPVPLVKDTSGWRFDTAAGKEEVLARRIGRNELKAIQIVGAYFAAQGIYARDGHDDEPAGVYAQKFGSDPGRQNGLYWPTQRGERRSPLGDRLPQAAEAQASGSAGPTPFHGYYFRILTAQGPSAPGGAKDYVVNGEMSAGFGLVAWPAEYDRTGIMTFIVNHDGVIHEKDLGPGTDAAARNMARYDPDPSWVAVE